VTLALYKLFYLLTYEQTDIHTYMSLHAGTESVMPDYVHKACIMYRLFASHVAIM